MKRHRTLAAMLIGCISMLQLPAHAEIDGGLEAVLDAAPPSEIVSTIVFLWEQGEIERLDRALRDERAPRAARCKEVLRTLRDTSMLTQPPLSGHLAALRARGRVARFEPLWLVNAIRVDATPPVIRQLARHPHVQRIYANVPVQTIATVDNTAQAGAAVDNNGAHGSAASVEPGVAAVRAPDAWAMGYTGSGVLVATLDTGVSGTHPAVASRWRGSDPAYQNNPHWAWFDPVTNTTSPQEFAESSHGTHTMGTLLGGAPGDSVGVAPGAEWITAAVLDRVDLNTTVADVIAAFEWIVDPDGDSATTWDVPRVCSNSWGVTSNHGFPQCDDLFWSFIDNAEAAGVLMLFAAGNEGSTGVRRPADRATDIYRNTAIAAIDPASTNYSVAGFSSRGPTYCTPDGSAAIKPDLAAPGVNTRSAVAGGGYGLMSGTSMATPHVAGVAALVLEACPHLEVNDVKQILFDTALDLGTPGKNNQSGWGMVDAAAAVSHALEMCDFSISLPNGAPEMIDPGVETAIAVNIVDAAEAVLPGSATLHYRMDGGAFESQPLAHLGGDQYEGVLPAARCDATPQFYIRAEGVDGSVRTHPPNAPEQLHTIAVGAIMDAPTIDHAFASGLPDGWTMTGLWNITSECGIDGECASEQRAYYGNPATCTYETGWSTNSGSMKSAPIAVPQIPDGGEATLSFCYTLETEENFAYDRATFRINGQNIITFEDALDWTTFTMDLASYAGQNIILEWHFNTVDGLTNFYHGWQIDRVKVTATQFVCEDPPAPEPCPADVDGDGVVEIADLLLMLGAWGECGIDEPCAADVNDDGAVDIADLLQLLGAWGPCAVE